MSTPDRQPNERLRTRSFYVAGRYVGEDGARRMRGAMYVEHWAGAVTRPWPVVMVHGGGQTGTCFTTKPDGGEGWAQAFARAAPPQPEAGAAGGVPATLLDPIPEQ